MNRLLPSLRRAACLAGAGAVLAGCKSETTPADTTKQPLATPATAGGAPAVPPAAAVHLDSGNTAYRAKAYDDALRHYRAAAAAAPDHAAPWYGVFMVGEVTKNKALTDSATAMVATRTGGAGLADSTMAKAHGGSAPMPSTLPPDHPSVNTLPPGHPTPGKAAPKGDGKGASELDG
ncbi:MAG: hypothetical protein MUE41_03240 [Gemmatimonadaceae bacterium]|nr:hypothetical protein [Gemmatimonadaceae bacterium]